jgi:small subunit ribosomal protein S1
MKQQSEDTGANSFASLFEKSLVKMEKLQPGQMVETHIVSISKDCVFLQLSGKSEGVMDKAEITDKDGKLTAEEGDAIKVYFLTAKNGEMRFTTRIAGDKAGSAMLENAFANKIPVDGLVEKEIKGGYEIRLGETRAFCPFSQMGMKRTENAETYVGKRLTFKIQEYKEGGRKIVVSNRAIQEEARQEQLEELKKSLHVNQVIKGTIKSIQDFGAFVDLGGVQALLPVSEISRTRVEDIRAVLTVGQEIEAEIIKIDWASERLSLSMKSLLSDPWSTAREKYPRDSRHSGTVARVTDFGAFVTLEPGIDGLLHVSELRGEDKYGNPKVAVKVGQKVEVQVLDVDVSKRRVSLKQATSPEDDETSKKYLGGDSSGDTYNPFAALLKKK